jgi:N6-adenosine-specific RNA methylase IME4
MWVREKDFLVYRIEERNFLTYQPSDTEVYRVPVAELDDDAGILYWLTRLMKEERAGPEEIYGFLEKVSNLP